MKPTIIKIENNQLFYRDMARNIRYKVFVIEQNVPEEIEYDEFEADSLHYLLFVDDVAAATCRWRHTMNGIKLERFAVLTEYRGKGLGERLVRHLLNEVLPEGKQVYLHAQEQVTGFYGRLGFKAYGEVFEEAGIRHFKMKYQSGL